MEAGKGLEMRKLVLSGFLASEEIYINQLEALLLVSIRSDLRVRLELLRGLKKKGDLDQSFPVGRVCGVAPLTAWPGGHCQKGPVLLSPECPLPVLGKTGEAQPG